MSRLKRLKAMKIIKRNKLKTTIKCLSLALMVGFTQVLGTYSLFTDSIDDLSNISISLGDLAVSADEGFTGDKIGKVNESISKDFVIRNEGTLKQSLNIQLAPHITEGINEAVLENISYTLESNDGQFKTITTNMNALRNQGVNITSINGKGDLILLPGESLNCKATISITDENILSKLSGKSVTFDLNVRAQQVNWNGNGFYDIYKQKNTFSIIKKELGPDQTEVIFDYCPCGVCIDMSTEKRSKAFKVDTSNVVPKGVRVSTAGIDNQWTLNGGKPSKPSENEEYYLHLTKDGYLYIVPAWGYTPPVDEILNRKLQIQLNLSNGTNLFFMVTFEKDGEESFIANWEQIPNPFVSTLPEAPVVSEETVKPENTEVPTVSEETVKPENTEVPIVSEETITPEDTEEPVVPETPQTSENTEVMPPKKEDETTL